MWGYSSGGDFVEDLVWSVFNQFTGPTPQLLWTARRARQKRDKLGNEEHSLTHSARGSSGKQKPVRPDTIPIAELSREGLEEQSLLSGGKRVKFKASWKGTIDSIVKPDLQKLFRDICIDLAVALWEIEDCGAAPTLPDGKSGGNGSALFVIDSIPYLILSKSEKTAGQKMDLEMDICVVDQFDFDRWHAYYYSVSEMVMPSSDTPMHFSALFLSRKFRWLERPFVALHGHALESLEEAQALGLPCSTERTLFASRQDVESLIDLLERYPYPLHKVFIRRDHGFFILGRDIKDAMSTFRSQVKPYIRRRRS